MNRNNAGAPPPMAAPPPPPPGGARANAAIDPDDIAELNGFYTNGIPEVDAHSCNVSNCRKLPGGKNGWSCERPDPKKCIPGTDRFVKASTAIALINEKVAAVRVELGAAAEAHSAANEASRSRIAELEGSLRTITASEKASNTALLQARQDHTAALAEEKRLKGEQAALLAEEKRAREAEKSAIAAERNAEQEARRANNSARATANAERAASAAAEASRLATAAKEALDRISGELNVAKAETSSARSDLATTQAEAARLDGELEGVTARLRDLKSSAEQAASINRGQLAELVKVYTKLKQAHINNLNQKIAQFNNYKIGRVIVRSEDDNPAFDAQIEVLNTQKGIISALSDGSELTPAASADIISKIDTLERTLQQMQDDENAEHNPAAAGAGAAAGLVGGKRKTRRRKAVKRKQTKRRKLRHRK